MNLYRRATTAISDFGRAIKESTEEDIMPVYSSPIEEDDYSGQVFNWGSLKSIIDSAVGFTVTGGGVGAGVKALSKGAVKGLTKLGKTMARTANTASRMSRLGTKMERLDAYIGLIQKTKPGLFENIGAATSTVIVKSAEARMEGVGAYENTLMKLTPLIEDGRITQEDAEEYANIAANTAFEYTMMTAATDFIPMKYLFRGKGLISKKLSAPTAWNQAKRYMQNSYLEGMEEMWQEAAQMEGEYDAFVKLKEDLIKDEDLKALKNLDLDPDQYPERWAERFGAFLGTSRALAAGTIGFISGPLQAYGMGQFGKKQRLKEEWDQYNRQQSKYQDNINMFRNEQKFKEVTKQVALSNEMREASQLLDDDVLASITEEVALTGIALDNFMNGTTDQLAEIIKEEGSENSVQLLSSLEKMNREFKKAKRYANPNEMFLLNRAKDISERLIQHYNVKAQDQTLDEGTRKSYERAADKEYNNLLDLKEEINTKGSKGNQLQLIEQEAYFNEMNQAVEAIDKAIDIPELEAIAAKFPELEKDVNDRINALRTIGSTGKKYTTSTKSINSQVKPQEVDETTEGNHSKIANKKYNKTSLTKEESTEYGKSKELIDEKSIKEGAEVLPNGRHKDNEGNVYTQNNMPVIPEANFKKMFNQNFIQERYNIASTAEGIDPVVASKEDVQDMYDYYNEVVDQVINPNELNKLMDTKLSDLFKIARTREVIDTESNIVSGQDSKPEDPKATKIKNDTIVEQAGNELLDVLAERDSEDLMSQEEKAKISRDEFERLKREQQALNGFIDALFDSGLDVLNDFRAIITELENATQRPDTVQKYFNRLKIVYASLTGQIIDEDYNTFMGITEPDPVIESDSISPEKLNQVVNVTTKYVSPTMNSEKLQNIYLDEDVENIDSRNKTPATSIAYLSQDYVWEYKGEKQVGRTTSNTTVDGNPILNPAKYSASTPITLEANEDYDGKIMLETGKLVNWQVMWNEYKLGDWNKFLEEHKLSPDLTIWDHYPITITGIETKELIGFVHDTAWVNKLNANDVVIEENRKALKEFRSKIIPKLREGIPFETTIAEKVIEINDDGVYSGFALNKNTTKLMNTAEALPDDLPIATKVITELQAPGKKNAIDNVMNIDFLDNYFSGTSFVLVPLGIKEGSMKYHAEPIINNKINNTQAKALRQAVEIFITQNPEVNTGLYEAYNSQGIDLLERDGLKKVLKKVVRLYNSKDRQTLEELIIARNGKAEMGFIELKGEEVHYGKSVPKVFKRNKTIDAKAFDQFENLVLKNMYFNISKDMINSTEEFNFVEVDPETNELIPYSGDYNTYVKQNSTTYMRSTKLDDGSYSSTIQNITRFDMRETEVKTEPEIKAEPTDITKDERVIRLAEKFEQSVNEFIKPVKDGKITLDKYLNAKEMAYKATKHSKHNKC
jgi:hypothetical protein